MRKRIKNISNKKIFLITLCVMIVILILGFTYAYWTRTFTQTGINENLYECFEIEFEENVEGVSQLQGYPQTDEEGLKTPAYEVTIKNTCNTAASYNVVLHKLNTSTLDDSHLKVAVDKDIRLLSETETTTNTLENATEARIINNGYVLGKQSKTIKVRSWMEENTSEEEGVNKSFAYKITIEATPTSNTLALNILNNNELKNIEIEYPNDGEPKYNIKVLKNQNVSLKSLGDDCKPDEDNDCIYIGKMLGYEGLGYKELNFYDYININTYTQEYKGYFTCGFGDNSDQCDTMYKIVEVTGDTVTKADIYTVEVDNSASGLYKTNDDDGDTYYFRGKVENNYVKFADKEWRIIRINGDGSIRMIYNVRGSQSAYSSLIENAKHVGYTYDNDHICTKENPCTTTSGTSSTIKENIEQWYANNLSQYDDQIEVGTFCNDTSNSTHFSDLYGAYDRVFYDGVPTLKCPNTEVNYGGLYKLKVGLINGDELSMAGLTGVHGYPGTENYLYASGWTLSPYGQNEIYYNDYYHNDEPGIINYNTTINSYLSSAVKYYSPVINLKADVKVTSGDGTWNNPYIIE